MDPVEELMGPKVSPEVSPKWVSVGLKMGPEVDSGGPRTWASDVGGAKPQDPC